MNFLEIKALKNYSPETKGIERLSGSFDIIIFKKVPGGGLDY